MTATRRAAVRVEYEGVDISATVSPYVVSASFTDNASGKADDFTLALEDRDGLWQGGWHPGKGATLTAWIVCRDWDEPGQTLALACGTFELDRIDLAVGRGGDRVTLKGVSAKVRNSLRGEKKHRAWENATLRRILRDIAEAAGMEAVFDAADIVLGRVDQRGEGDLAFLKRLADQYGLNFKAAEDALVVYDAADYDARPASMTLTRGSAAIVSVRLGDAMHDVYRACTVTYHDALADEDREYTYTPDNAPVTGQTLRINERVESQAAAMPRAASELRRRNAGECTGTLTLMGEPRLRGGSVVALAGFGGFDGTYFVESATHAVDKDSGYTTDLNVRRTLGY
ncbi:phage late control D family protein [Pseudodesulfovibrio pelocollis]|uniref:phage late control D family protein n=1 Tax=Pseudodesulfovibrio pelocollis TaxID=3051432 RepID=UPI00255AA6C9|nr:contractile injection system protein, VgrG/Pvc8 family [Pseudodesulfovibrio sp. SB368]